MSRNIISGVQSKRWSSPGEGGHCQDGLVLGQDLARRAPRGLAALSPVHSQGWWQGGQYCSWRPLRSWRCILEELAKSLGTPWPTYKMASLSVLGITWLNSSSSVILIIFRSTTVPFIKDRWGLFWWQMQENNFRKTRKVWSFVCLDETNAVQWKRQHNQVVWTRCLQKRWQLLKKVKGARNAYY